MSATNTIQIHLRLPAALHEALVRLAEQERRSLNSQIVVMLEDDIEEG